MVQEKTLLKYHQKIEEDKKKNKKQPPNLVNHWSSDPGPMRRGHDFPEERFLRKTMIRGYQAENHDPVA